MLLLCLLQSCTFVTNVTWKLETRNQMVAKLSIMTKWKQKCFLLWAARPVQFSASKASGENEAGLVPEDLQVNTDHSEPRDPIELKEIKDPRDFRDLQDLKAFKDLRAIWSNLSQPLQLWPLRRPLWWTNPIRPRFSVKLKKTQNLKSHGWSRIPIFSRINELCRHAVEWWLQLWRNRIKECTLV